MDRSRRVAIAVSTSLLSAALVGVAALPSQAVDVSRWYFTNQLAGGPAEFEVDFGTPTETDFYVGDWDGNGIDDLARRQGNTFTLLNLTSRTTSQIGYGKPGDEVFVGDWDANGTDTFAVRRGNKFFVKNSVASGPADIVIGYGKAADEVFVGDWDANGTDTFAVRRGNVFFARNTVTTGNADIVFGYGRAADQVLVGDWNGDRTDTFAVRRGNEIFIRNDFATAPAEFSFGFGKATDDLYPGDWNGDNIDTFAVRRATEANTATDFLAALTVAPEATRAGYDRNLFPHWSDLDGDCINTRREVLAAESLITPTITGCTVTAGQWYSVYDGVSTTDPSTFDVDHVVPLAEAWDSGAATWATSRRELFANNLDLADHLAAVSASSNRSKGDRDPAEWLPTLTADHCRYMTAWVVIKAQWGLTIDPAENTAIASILNGCPSLPVDQVLEGDNITPPNPTPPSPTPPPPPTPGCDPAYPTVCIPPPPPDLNCGDIPYTNFTVLAPDPHNFDGNNDGIGCQI